jgi:23S rRNA (cytidine2498-2'-O)-methyltransferase
LSFIFASCHPGFEALLKQDVARRFPSYRFAFSRRGVITFKVDGTIPFDAPQPSIWARSWGRSLGQFADVQSALAALPPEVVRVHVAPRDPELEGVAEQLEHVHAELASAGRFRADSTADIGELVVSFFVAPGEPLLCGVHQHTQYRSPFPTGAPVIAAPAEAPSRAYLKLEELIAIADLPIAPGQVAVEVGAAPGGAVYALLRRGVSVWAVDPAPLADHVVAFEGPANARAYYISNTFGGVTREQLPPKVDWVLVDANLAPPVVIHATARLLPAWKRRLKAAVFTLKMNDVEMQNSFDTWLARIRSLGFRRVRAFHLPSNRKEVCVVADSGLARSTT